MGLSSGVPPRVEQLNSTGEHIVDETLIAVLEVAILVTIRFPRLISEVRLSHLRQIHDEYPRVDVVGHIWVQSEREDIVPELGSPRLSLTTEPGVKDQVDDTADEGSVQVSSLKRGEISMNDHIGIHVDDTVDVG
jgi:hypothetical protein